MMTGPVAVSAGDLAGLCRDWHGLRLENKYDGVPHETQQPIPIGGSFTYRIQFPDPGLYWYHPHIREDYTQEMGLYGNIIVEPIETGYWPPANRDVVLTLDDVLLEDGKIATFSVAETNGCVCRSGNTGVPSRACSRSRRSPSTAAGASRRVDLLSASGGSRQTPQSVCS